MEELETELLKRINENVIDVDLLKEIFEFITYNELPDYNISIELLEEGPLGVSNFIDLHNHFIFINLAKHREKNVIYAYFQLLNTFFHELDHVYQNILLMKAELHDYTLKGESIKYKEFVKKIDSLSFDYATKTQIISYYLSDKLMNEKGIKYQLYHDCFSTEHEAMIVGGVRAYKLLEKAIIDDYEYEYGIAALETLIAEYKKHFNKLVAPMDRVGFTGEDLKIYNLLINRNISQYDRLKLGLPIESSTFKEIKSTIKRKKSIDYDEYILKFSNKKR